MCQHAEEHFCPEKVFNISGSELRLSGDASAPFSGARGGKFVFPAPFQTRLLYLLEGISEADGTHGVCFSGMSSRLTTHAPAAAIAEMSSPLDGVDFGPFEHRGLSSKGFLAAARTAACTDSHRQHVCGLVHKSPRQHTLQGSVQSGNKSPDMCRLLIPLHQRSAHTRSPEPLGGHAFEEGHAPRVGSDDLEPLWKSGGGSVRHERECALPAVLLPVSLPAGRGRADIALASSQAVCVSSDQDIDTGVMQDQGGAGFCDNDRPELAEPALVPRPDRTAGGTAMAEPHQEGSAIPG